MERKFVIATKNAHKLVEFKRILEPLGYEVLSQADVNVDIDVDETGETFVDNAGLKARAIYNATGMMTLADDSGLCVEHLNGAPGIYSARYGGEGLNDKGRCELLLKNLDDVPTEKRKAKFVCAIYAVFDDDIEKSFVGECRGYIGEKMVGENGFGYDPVFMVNEEESFATVAPDKKDSMSHRAKALEKLENYLKIIEEKH